MATDLHGTELMYNRIIGPRTNALSVDQHKSRHGIRLRSMSFPRKNKRGLRSPSSPALSMTTPMATQLVPMVTSSSALLQREKTFPVAAGATPKGSSMVPTSPQAGTPEPEVIEEEVFPMQYPLLHDEMNRQRAIAAQSFSAGLKIKQVPLPQLYKQEKDQPRSRTPSARGVRTVPVYKDRETPSPAPQATASRLYLRDTRSPIRNMSEQQRRLQDEEKARMRTKVMKKTAEIVSHRVDRMYYMMGSNVPLLYRYQVDEEELNRLRELSQARSSTSHYGRGLSSGMGKYKQWPQEMAPQDYQAPPDNPPGVATIPVIRHEAEGSSEQLNSTKKHPSPVSSRASPTAEHQQMHSIHIQVERLSLKDGSMQDGPASLNVEINSSPGGTEKNPSAGGGERGQQDDIGSAAESVALPGEDEEEEETSGVPTEEAASAWQKGEDGAESAEEQEEAVLGAGETETGQDQSQLESGGPQLTVSRHSTPQPSGTMIKIVRDDRRPRSRDDVFNTEFENPDNEDESSQRLSKEQFQEGELEDGEWAPQRGDDDDDDEHGGNNVGEGESYTRRSYGEFNVTVRTVEKNGDSQQPESGDRGEERTRGRKQDSNKTMIGGLRRKGKPEGGYADSEPEVSAGGRGDADLAAATEEYYRQLHEGQGAEEEPEEEDMGDGAGNDEDAATRKYPFLKKFMFTFMTSRQEQIFEKKFDEIDYEGQGVITMEMLKSRMFGNLKERDLDLLMKVFDLNSDKTIDKREFVTVASLNDKLRGTTTLSPNDPLELNLDKLAFHIQAYKEMFEVVDSDGDGRLTMEEIMLLLSAAVGTQMGTDKDLVRAIIKVLDKDGNGSIDFVEYLSFIPFFLHIHQFIVKRPISITDVENARQAVQKALSRRSL